MKRYPIFFMMLACLLTFGSPASSLTIDDVGVLDHLLFQTRLEKSGDAAESKWIADMLEWNPETTRISKIEEAALTWSVVDGYEGDYYAHAFSSPNPIDYFLVKANRKDGGDTHFLYENLADLSYAVISLLDIGIDEYNIDAVSHIAIHAPEPATLLLLGTGLVGLAGYGRRRKK